MRFVTWLLTTAAAVAVATWLFDGIYFTGPSTGSAEIQHKIPPLPLVALILGGVSMYVGPVVKFFSIPFIVLTIGLFYTVTTWLMVNGQGADGLVDFLGGLKPDPTGFLFVLSDTYIGGTLTTTALPSSGGSPVCAAAANASDT